MDKTVSRITGWSLYPVKYPTLRVVDKILGRIILFYLDDSRSCF